MAKAQFVPGLLCTAALFEPQVIALGSTLEIAVADHRGHDNMAEMVRHILAPAPERFVLAGLSMGGYVSLEIMRQAPERVSALILMDTSARAETPEQTARRKVLIETARHQGLDAVVDALMPMVVAQPNRDRDDLISVVRRMAHDTGVETFARQQAAIMSRTDSRDLLGAIACPTLVIVGEEDALMPPHLAKEIADGISGARLRVIGGSGHLVTLERPEAVNDAIGAFVAELG